MKRLIVPVVIAGILGAFACTSDSGKEERLTELKDPRELALIDEELMLALAQAKNFHYKAEVYLADGKPDEAIASVRQILSLRFPAGAPEAEDVRNDARAVLAKMLIGRDQLEEAMSVVDEGLATKTRDSFFVSNLHTVKGQIFRARATKLGDDPAATGERRKAIDELDWSIRINKELLDRKDRR